MLAIDWINDVSGNALKLMLGVKQVKWHRCDGQSANLASGLVVQAEGLSILGEPACTILLEQHIPSPSLFPNGNKGMPMALSAWRDTIGHTVKDDAYGLKAHAALVMRQIEDGRPYLQGNDISLADIQAAAWILSGNIQNIVSDVAGISEWCARLAPLLQPNGEQDLQNIAVPKTTVAEKMLVREIDVASDTLSVTITARSDLLCWGYLLDGTAICVSPLSHSFIRDETMN